MLFSPFFTNSARLVYGVVRLNAACEAPELLKKEHATPIIGGTLKGIVGFFILILTLTLFGAGFSEAISPPHLMRALSPKSWTIMVYLDGDCDLEMYQIQAFLMMASVGSTADINVLVQFDRIDGYDSRFGD